MTTLSKPVTFSPNLLSTDEIANYWLRQVTLRLRREVSWRWYQQGRTVETLPAPLPLLEEQLSESLDLSRYWQDKCLFFQSDVTAHYLTEQINLAPPQQTVCPRGSFSWVVEVLNLDEAARFLLALALAATLDSAAGAVIAVCQNSASATSPTLALAQKLWDSPAAILAVADIYHPLWCYGLLQNGAGMSSEAWQGESWQSENWQKPLTVSPTIARQLLFFNGSLPAGLALWSPLSVSELVSTDESQPTEDQPTHRLVANRLQTACSHLRIAPVQGARGTQPRSTIQQIAQTTKRPVLVLNAPVTQTKDYLTQALKPLLILCWLRGLDVYLPQINTDKGCGDRPFPYPALQTCAALPITVFLRIADRAVLKQLPSAQVLPILELPRLSYSDRVQVWYRALGLSEKTVTPAIQKEIADCARQFRYEVDTIHRIAQGIHCAGPYLESPTESVSPPLNLSAACRAEMALDMGELAQPVLPRFSQKELVLPPKQNQQFQEIEQAMRSLTQVHYQWGTARAWNECGISVLFAGPPGTGKTMAAESLAHTLQLPMYRIDLSQVVNKYIGETEKNLKRLFDTADLSDTVLFFDEADALFGRRTEVKDAHDRYANLEISYLLERMERFKGLAILATNRQKDLDEAFLRRLRYIIEFPLPEEHERRRLWEQVMPAGVDVSRIDFAFLARQFPLAGGHIRSIVFNACLQTATNDWTHSVSSPTSQPVLKMERIMIAVKREYDKLNRSVSLSQFGPYANLINQETNRR